MYWSHHPTILLKVQIEKADLQKRREDLQKKMELQKERARLERSLIFNPRTEKMEVFDNPLKEEEKEGFKFPNPFQ